RVLFRSPEPLRVLHRLAVQALVIVLADARVRGEFGLDGVQVGHGVFLLAGCRAVHRACAGGRNPEFAASAMTHCSRMATTLVAAEPAQRAASARNACRGAAPGHRATAASTNGQYAPERDGAQPAPSPRRPGVVRPRPGSRCTPV